MDQLSTGQIVFLVCAFPFAVYLIAWVASAAFFRAKAHYLRRFFHESDQTKGGGQ